LGRGGYEVIEADVERALEMVSSEPSGVDILVTNTPQYFLPVRERVALLYIASCPAPELACEFPRCVALPKPFRPKQLLAATEMLLGARNAA
jgi:hypothetical protein